MMAGNLRMPTLAGQFPLAHWCPGKKGTKPWTNRGTYFLFHENCTSAFSLPESLSQSVSRAQPLALSQLARFHFSLEFEICHVLTFLAKRLRSAHVRNPPSLHFAQLPSLHKVLPQFSWKVAEHSKKLQTRNYPIFPWELLRGDGTAPAADTGTYSLISLQGYKLVPFSQQGARFSEPSFVFQIRYTNKLIAIFKNTKQESPIMRTPWASEFLPH